MHTNTTNVWEIVEKIQHQIYASFDTAEQSGSDSPLDVMQSLYEDTINAVVFDMSSLPVHREIAELDPFDDPYEVMEAYDQILEMIGAAFGHSISKIELDMHKIIIQYTVDDLRTLIKLKQNNRLH
jgi:hypothetical protein